MLIKLSKEKGCEVIGRWKKACVRHFYWAVTSTRPKLGDLILAKSVCYRPQKSVRVKEVHMRDYVNNDRVTAVVFFFFSEIFSFAIIKYMYFPVFGMSNF